MKYFVVLFSLLTLVANGDDFENYLNYRAGLEEYKGDVKCATKYETQLRFLLNNPDKNISSKLQLIQLAKKVELYAVHRSHSITINRKVYDRLEVHIDRFHE